MVESNIINVLMYILKNHNTPDAKTIDVEKKSLINDLEHAGFMKSTIEKALVWLDGLYLGKAAFENKLSTKSYRIYSDDEKAYLNDEAINYLILLENLEILDPTLRELVINQLVALSLIDIDLSIVKWVVLLVLYNNHGIDGSLICLEWQLFGDNSISMH